MEDQPTTAPDAQQESPTGEQHPPADGASLVESPSSALENVNLVTALGLTAEGKKFLEELGKKVVKNRTEDKKSGDDFREHIADSLRLYLGQGGNFMKGPAKGSPRPVHPTLAKIVNRIYPRVMSVVLQSEPVAVPTSDDAIDRALRLGQHISWEKRAKHPEWAPCMASSVLQWILFGSMFRSVGWDPLENRKAIDDLSMSDVVLPYTEKDSTPDLRYVSRISKRLLWPKHKIKRLARKGEWLTGAKEIFSKTGEKQAQPYREETEQDPIREVITEFEGQQLDAMAKRDAYLFIEQHLWLELPMIPGWNEDPDLPRRCAVWVEVSTQKVLRLVIMEREVRSERVRVANETKLQNIQLENWRMTAEKAAAQGFAPPQAPRAKTIAPPEMEPCFSIIHYRFMPNPEGIYGLGAWAFVGGLNEVINDLLGEDLIAQRMANMQGGLLSDEVGAEKGTFELEYGKFNHLEGVSAQQLKDGVMPLPFERPKGNLGEYIEKLDGEAQAVMSSSDQQSGMAGPSHETAKAATLRAAAGATAVTASTELFLIPLAYEYKLYARMNAMNMNDVEYFFVTEPHAQTGKPTPQPRQITRAEYEADYEITFEADVRLEVDPGIGQSALEAYALTLKDPIASKDPNLCLAALKKAYRSLKAQDLAARLPDNIPPPPPPSPMSQTDENAGFLEEQDHPVLDDDDDMEHLQRMDEFEQSGTAEHMTPTGKQMYERHKQKHKANAYRKANTAPPPAAMPGEGAPGPMPNGGPPAQAMS